MPLIFLFCAGNGDRTRTAPSGQGILSEFFFRTISSPYHFWLRVGRSCLLLRRLTSQVVSTPSLVYQCLARPPYYLFMVVILQPNSSNFFNERFHSRRDSTMYIVSPSCLPIPTSRHNLLYFKELLIINITNWLLIRWTRWDSDSQRLECKSSALPIGATGPVYYN